MLCYFKSINSLNMQRHGSWGFFETLWTMRSKKYKSKTGQRAKAMMPFSMQRQKKRPKEWKSNFTPPLGSASKEKRGQNFSQVLVKILCITMNDASKTEEGRFHSYAFKKLAKYLAWTGIFRANSTQGRWGTLKTVPFLNLYQSGLRKKLGSKDRSIPWRSMEMFSVFHQPKARNEMWACTNSPWCWKLINYNQVIKVFMKIVVNSRQTFPQPS